MSVLSGVDNQEDCPGGTGTKFKLDDWEVTGYSFLGKEKGIVKKALLAILLLGLVLAVSYVKSYREDQKRSEAVREIADSASREFEELSSSVDSLKTIVGKSRTSYEDSIQKLNEYHAQETDSLKQALFANDKEIKHLAETIKKVTSNTRKSEKITGAPKTDSSDFHHRVLLYYKKRFKDLPADLSSYERRVALSEIRDETARRFSISVKELNRIRADQKLSF